MRIDPRIAFLLIRGRPPVFRMGNKDEAMNQTAERSYWEEVIEESLCEQGVSLPPKEIEAIAKDVEMAHENYGMAFYQPTGPSQAERDLKTVSEELKTEREKIVCDECCGRGRIISHGPVHSSNSECWKCNGFGRHSP